jgi:GMP synthase-like glutamine amidotransferase
VPSYVFRAKKDELPPLLDSDRENGFTHVILSGSEASIVEREPWVEKEIEFVREAAQKDIPILGSCYGHQLLAIALTDPSHVRRCDRPEIGWLPITILKDNALLGSPGIFYAYTVHFDEVIDLNDSFEVLASTPGCKVHAFCYQGKPWWGIQSHPEINVSDGRKFFQKLLALDSPETPLYAQALKSKPRDSCLISRIVEEFIRS